MSKTVYRQIESFKGIDYRRSHLTRDGFYLRDATNCEFSEGYALKKRLGQQVLGPCNGFREVFPYTFYDKKTNATTQYIMGANAFLFRLTTKSLVITRTGGSTTWSVTVSLNTVSAKYRFVLTQGGSPITLVHPITGSSNAYLDLGTGLEYDAPANYVDGGTTTIFDLQQAVDAHANFSCPVPTQTARVNGAVASNVITVDAGHTFAALDYVSIFNWEPLYEGLAPIRLTATTGTTITFNTLYPDLMLNDDQVIGIGSCPAASIPIGTYTSDGSTVTLPYYYWEPVNYTTDMYSREADHYTFNNLVRDNADPAVFVEAGNSVQILTDSKSIEDSSIKIWEGYPFKYDGQRVYRAGVPTTSWFSYASGGAGVLTGTYRWKVVFKHTDNTGAITLGTPSTFAILTLAANSAALSFFSSPVNLSKGPGGMVVNGNQVAVNTITVVSLPTLGIKQYDWFSFLDRISNAVVVRQVLSFTATTITIDGAPVNVNNNDLIVPSGSIGINSDAAIVNGNQTGVSTVTVFNTVQYPNRIRVGDTICFLDRAATAPYQITRRKVTAVTATSISWSASEGLANFTGGDVISANLSVEIYRTLSSGSIYYLLDEIPNNPYVLSVAITDNTTDATIFVREVLIEPDIGKERDMPPRASLGTAHQGVIVYSGIRKEPEAIAWTDIIEGYEAVPLASNYETVPTITGGPITAIASDTDDRLSVFKARVYYDIVGSLSEGAFSIRTVTSGDYGVAGSRCVIKIKQFLFCLGELGMSVVYNGQLFQGAGDRVDPAIWNNFDISLSKTKLFNDTTQRRLVAYINSASAYASSDADPNALCFNYHYDRLAEDGLDMPILDSSYANALSPNAGGFVIDKVRYNLNRSLVTSAGAKTRPGHFFRTLALANGAAGYNDNHLPISQTIRTHFELFEAPSKDKEWQWLKVYSTIDRFENFVANTFTLKTYRNFQLTTIDTQGTISFPSSTTFEDEIKLNSNKARSLCVELTNSAYNECPHFTGYEVCVALPYKQENFSRQ